MFFSLWPLVVIDTATSAVCRGAHTVASYQVIPSPSARSRDAFLSHPTRQKGRLGFALPLFLARCLSCLDKKKTVIQVVSAALSFCYAKQVLSCILL